MNSGVVARIAELENALVNPPRYPTEVYVRIVGYYRSVANWNAGKREEFNHRVPYVTPAERVEWALDRAQERKRAKPSSYIMFTQDRCPNCPPMKAKVPELGLMGSSVDVASEEGFQQASKWEVTATPTLILLDGEGKELDRIMSVRDWTKIA